VQDRIREWWGKLGKRDKAVVAGGIGLLLLVLVIEYAVFPYAEARKKLDQSLRSGEKVLKEMVVLGAEYETLRKGVDELQRGIARRPGEFTLFSYLEKKAGDSGIRSNIKQMKPSRSPMSGPYEEVSVEIKLEKITLKQLVHFMHAVESPENVVRVKRITVKKSPEDTRYLAALIQVVTYQQTRPDLPRQAKAPLG